MSSYMDVVVDINNPKRVVDYTAKAIHDILAVNPAYSYEVRDAVDLGGGSWYEKSRACRGLKNLGFHVEHELHGKWTVWHMHPIAPVALAGGAYAVSRSYSEAVGHCRGESEEIAQGRGDPLTLKYWEDAAMAAGRLMIPPKTLSEISADIATLTLI